MMELHFVIFLTLVVTNVLAVPSLKGMPTYSSKAFNHENKGKCDKKYSDLTPQHSMCLENPKRSDEGVSEEEKTQILKLHNDLRGKAGHEEGIEAADMLKLYWDDELAQIAQKWASNCKFGHEPDGRQRESPGRFKVGQNVASPAGKERDWPEVMRMLYDEEVVKFKYGITGNLGPIGHYTAIVWANTTLVGCGVAFCDQMRGGNYFYVCNFGPSGNWYGKIATPFKKGARGSACPKSYDAGSGLCDCKGKVCKNGGSLNPDGCVCTCQYDVPWLDPGIDCDIDCSKAKDSQWGCESNAHCKDWDNWPLEYCPIRCGTCPGKKDYTDKEGSDNTGDIGEPDAPEEEESHELGPEPEGKKQMLVRLLEELEEKFEN